MRILLVEPWMTGSHLAWATGYQSASSHEVHIVGLPGELWRWRLRGGALPLAEKVTDWIDTHGQPDLVLVSGLVDVAELLGLARRNLSPDVAVVIYQHESQMVYPVANGSYDRGAALRNWMSWCAADLVLFNSYYHLRAVADALPEFVTNLPDNTHVPMLNNVVGRFEVFPVGVDLTHVTDREPFPVDRTEDEQPRDYPPLPPELPESVTARDPDADQAHEQSAGSPTTDTERDIDADGESDTDENRSGAKVQTRSWFGRRRTKSVRPPVADRTGFGRSEGLGETDPEQSDSSRLDEASDGAESEVNESGVDDPPDADHTDGGHEDNAGAGNGVRNGHRNGARNGHGGNSAPSRSVIIRRDGAGQPDRFVSSALSAARRSGPPVILWPHRWERDKDPAAFIAALDKVVKAGLEFRLVLAGQDPPSGSDSATAEREEAERRFGSWILVSGELDRREYLEALGRCDLVVSCARHEFFGIAVVEAVASGCVPVLPNALSYPELIRPPWHSAVLYEPGSFGSTLVDAVARIEELRSATVGLPQSMRRFDWSTMAGVYDRRLEAVVDRLRSTSADARLPIIRRADRAERKEPPVPA